MLRAVNSVLVALVVLIGACSADEKKPEPVTPGIAKPTGHGAITMDQLEAELLAGVEDEPVPMTEADLDKYFPLVERLTTPEPLVDRDPTKGDSLDSVKAFNAFTSAENPDEHFTIDVMDPGVTPAHVVRAKKGILFGMASWDGFKPGFSVTAASKSTGGKPFKVSMKMTADPKVQFRAYVLPCGGAPGPTNTIAEIVASIDADTCIPRLVLPIDPAKPMEETLSPFMFVHEVAHVAQSYWQRSQKYIDQGGLKQAGAYNAEQSWQFESDAQFTGRHAPESYAYDEVLANGCPFEPLRRGAYSWSTFKGSEGTDSEKLLAYQMGIFVDQITWHRFGKNPAWTYDWLVADVDPRSKTKPITPTRKLLRLVSKDSTKTALESFNVLLLKTGVDLYFRGKNPWTTRQLSRECIRPGATAALPLLSIDALRVDIGDLSEVAKLRVSLEASRDIGFLRAGVAAAELDDAGTPKFITCLKSITESGLAGSDPRAGCMSSLTGLSVLTPKNNFRDDVQLPITFEAGRKYAIVAIVAHLAKKSDAPNTPINVTLRAEPVSTPPGNTIAKSQCGALTEEYRSNCKTSNCLCIGNAYCEATVDPPPASCEKMQQECYIFCLLQKDECDCSSFCDLLYARLACRSP